MQKLFTKQYTRETEIGKIYGFLKVVDFFDQTKIDGKDIRAKVLVQCQRCGSEPYIQNHTNLTKNSNTVISCGCIKSDKMKQMNIDRAKHGMYNNKYYPSCSSAIKRCRQTSQDHEYYYDRGIKCFWTHETIANFIRYLEDNLPERKPGETLDRINNNGNYEPGNIRWASKGLQIENQRPRRTNHEVDQLNKEIIVLKEKINRAEAKLLQLEMYQPNDYY